MGAVLDRNDRSITMTETWLVGANWKGDPYPLCNPFATEGLFSVLRGMSEFLTEQG
jgi:hypothetical protein